MRYELLEHTADVMIKAKESVTFEVCGHDLESLLYNFLSEFLYYHDAKNLLLSHFEVKIDGMALKCTAKGEKVDPSRHPHRHDVKAVTYHMLSVQPKEPSVTVIFDI